MIKVARVTGKDQKNILLKIIIVVSKEFFSVSNLSAMSKNIKERKNNIPIMYLKPVVSR